MKKYIMLLLMASLMAAACSKDDLSDVMPSPSQDPEMPDTPAEPAELSNYTFEAETASENSQTRVDFDMQTKYFTWSEGDPVLAFYAPVGGTFKPFNREVEGKVEDTPFIAETAGGKTRFTVTGTTAVFDPAQRYNYTALYPYPQTQPDTEGNYAYTIPKNQRSGFQTGFNLMYATVEDQPAFVANEGEDNFMQNPEFRFNHLTTWVAFYVKDPQGVAAADFEITGLDITFPATKQVVGKVRVNPTRVGTDGLRLENVKCENKVHVDFAKPVKPVDRFAPESAALVTLLPFELAEGEAFTVTIIGRTANISTLYQEVVCTPKSRLEFRAGDFRKINLSLKDSFKESEIIRPVGGNSIQDLLGTDGFAPLANENNYTQIYGKNNYSYFKKAGQVMTAASRVWQVGNEGSEARDNVIILDNTVTGRDDLFPSTTQSAFYMPVETVLPGFYESGYKKDLEVKFKAYILFSGNKTKQDAPLMIATNHCDESTWKNSDSGFNKILTTALPVANVHYTAQTAPQKGYPDVPVTPGWVEYKITIPYEQLTLSEFLPNSNGTAAYIGFKIDAYDTKIPRMLIYLKDVEFRETNRRGLSSKAWMGFIKDNPLVSDLSLPGTHDSATWTIPDHTLQCQQLSIPEQLLNGVRVIDLRPSATPNLMINHASTPTGVEFGLAINDIASFLTENPTETCIVMMKNESGADKDWARHMKAYLDQNRNRTINGKPLFRLYEQGLHLNDVRGQILLLSRAEYDGDLVGGRIEEWASNTTNFKTLIANTMNTAQATQSEVLWVQDNFLGLTTTNNKTLAIRAYLDRARDKNAADWLLNYLSLASGMVNNPQDNAVIFNKVALEYVEQDTSGAPVGIVMMDFAGIAAYHGDRLLDEIINQNFERTF